MKSLFSLLMFFTFLILIPSVRAQNDPDEFAGVPLNPYRSIVFGQDIVINNLPHQDQGTVAICSASNGWLYAIYSNDSLNRIGYYVMRSKDNGLSWNRLYSYYAPSYNSPFYKFNLIALDNSGSNQKLLIGYSGHYYGGVNSYDFMEVLRFVCDPFTYEATLFWLEPKPYHDIAIAWDNNYPAIGSNPNSIGILYSTTGVKDSVIFLSSSDGGMTMNNRKVVAVSTKKFRKVTLAYGRSASQNTGQYYAAWEEHADTSSTLGHIYTSHSYPNFNSPFTTPVKLDDLDPALLNLCRNPVIACQANNVDNDSANLTEVVLFEKFNSGSGDYDVMGFYNKKAVSGTTFNVLNVAATLNNELQPEINFSQFDSNFTITYFDSTTQKLPSLSKNMNMANPNMWNIISPGYNETFNLAEPNPKIAISEANQKAIYCWIANRNDGKGVALFDASYIPATGIDDNILTDVARLISVYPNPCNSSVTMSFEMKKPEKVVITLYNLVGKQLGIITDQTFHSGSHRVQYDLSGYQAGIYLYTLTVGISSTTGKICIIK